MTAAEREAAIQALAVLLRAWLQDPGGRAARREAEKSSSRSAVAKERRLSA
jgi:hypothetical protein